ncbi:MAG: phage major capsid protein [Bacilli bacterium]|nr:phage major capsid protein [Bacilli bacterium]
MKLEGLNLEALVQELNDAPAEEKSAKIVDVIQKAVNESKNEIVERYQREFVEVQANKDNFAKYGLRNLNTEEKSFIDKLKDPKQLAVFSTNDQDELIPTSITNYVFEDLRQEHPFLKYVKFTPAGVKKWILSEASGKAKWGKIDAKIVDEISAALSEIDMDANKLSAFAFIPKGILDLGYEWIERYIREVLLEVNEDGLEEGFIAGNGKNAPIGLLKKLSGATDGVYPDRIAEVIEDFSIKSLGAHFYTLTNNGKRKVGKVLMLVNPADAYTKVAEASTYLNASGEFKKVFPFAIEVIESVHVPVNKAILYIPNTYVGGISRMGISFSDQYQFLEDNRVYKIVTYGNGRLVHENQAVVLDITNVKPLSFNVKVVSDEEIGSL